MPKKRQLRYAGMRIEAVQQAKISGGGSRARKNHIGMYGVQTA